MTTLPNEMTVISILQPGGVEVLKPIKSRVPYPEANELLIKVQAAGINRPDILQREGLYPAPKGASPIPGLEVSGEVVVAGRDTQRFKVGDHVCALVSGGGYSEYCLAEEGSTLPIPKELTAVEAAGLPEVCLTVWHNVFERGALSPDEWLLIHGGASGIGTAAIQLAHALGSNVITTVGSDEKAEFCEQLGAKKAINYLKEDYVSITKDMTEKKGADVILDMIGGDYMQRNIDCAAEDGRIVQIAFMNGSISEVNFMRLMLKRLTLTGSTLRSRSAEVKSNIALNVEKNIWPLIESGSYKPIIHSTFPLVEVAKAHELMQSRQHTGKIILTV